MQTKVLALALASCMTFSTTSAQNNEGKKMKAYMVADAHLDTQWNWDIQTTIKQYVWNTLSQNLYLLDKYPNYVFNFEGAVKYSWMKEYYPEQYEKMKKYVANGRWHLTGSGWDANETVIVSPESWLRNVLLGQNFYRTEFGKESTDIFLPDCFGFSYFIPTLASHCGLIGFSTQKLGWRNNAFFEGGKKYPFTIGLWQGVDGSRIMMTHGFGYGERFKDSDLSSNKRLMREISESPLNMVYRYYGTGDTGGSPNLPSVRAVEKGIKGDGPIEIISATSDQLYKDFLPYENHPELPVYDGELFMDVHGTGCYTSQAAMKLYNRQNEQLGDAAERASVVAEWLGQVEYPQRDLTESWKRVFLHQFHDDLPGTSIPRAYEFSWNDELISLQRFSKNLTNAVSGVANRMNTNVSGTPVIIYNTQAYPVSNVTSITLPDMAVSYHVTDAKGHKVASQVVTDSKGNRSLLVDASVPGTGFAVYSVKAGGKAATSVSKDANVIENSVYKVTVDKQGNIASLIDKRNGKELVASGKSIGLVVFDDCKSEAWPAWEILKHTIDKEPLIIKENVSVKMLENGPLRKSLLISKSYGDSKINQYIRLYEGSQADRIDFYNEVDWHSLNALLKVQFPLNVSNEKATYDIGLGSVERGNNRDNSYEVYSHQWTDLTDRSGDYGVTILNDCKYGWDKPNDNTIRLSLLYSPKPGNGYTYQERQDFGYHEFTYSLIGHEGQLNKANTVQRATAYNSPLHAFESPKHKGDLGREFSFASSDNDHVVVRALKKAENGDEYVVRVYETAGKDTQTATISFASNIVKAVEADGTEKEIGSASFSGNKLNVNIKPFSVKTYRLKLEGNVSEKAGTCYANAQSLELPFNKNCFSHNEFRSAGDFEGGNSYAAELLPKEGLTVDGVHFTFGEMDTFNGLACQGDTIKLPADGNYNKVYLLAASSAGDRTATFTVGNSKQTVNVPYYTGFIGQWGHEGHTQGYLKDADIAYVGTHSHSRFEDRAYEFTYMFKYGIDIPKGATEIILPTDKNVVIFAATTVNENNTVKPAGELFRTNNKTNEANTQMARTNILKGAKIISVSGAVNDNESAEKLIDGDMETKWCDTNNAPNYVAFDLGSEKTFSGWRIINAGSEETSYITRACLLQVRNSLTEEWKTVDMIDGNRNNDVDRNIKAVKARYVRLYVTGPAQSVNESTTRIYEFELYQ